MAAAANFAWANRQVLTDGIRQSFQQVFAGSTAGKDVGLVYDIAHNIAKMETHEIEGRKVRVCLHRKGATRAFPAGHPDIPDRYRGVGQPVLMPGSMGTKSYVLVGTPDAMRLSFGSTAHGAGRLLSRKSSKKADSGRDVLDRLTGQGIVVRTGSFRGLAEERPEAYKDVDQVVSVVVQAGLARIVAELRPRAVIKG
jgi:tRNA-splicing ligase RtcB